MAKNSALMISGWLYGLSAGNTSPVIGSVPAAWACRISRCLLVSCISFTTYDEMGNIKTLARDGGTANFYHYFGNQLHYAETVTNTLVTMQMATQRPMVETA
ncbi:hypothetical protein [Pedobacter sp. Leaf176]|uniref:hypothetical protein n=1 Tax=Pedobacter sp. Leaf176 TaxID=1736286 RepID=UPI0012FCC6B2|nr:hypothetical protein [Pedobacter sp. Leaf176]